MPREGETAVHPPWMAVLSLSRRSRAVFLEYPPAYPEARYKPKSRSLPYAYSSTIQTICTRGL